MFCLVFVFSAAFTIFIVLTVCLSVVYLVYDFIINKYKKYSDKFDGFISNCDLRQVVKVNRQSTFSDNIHVDNILEFHKKTMTKSSGLSSEFQGVYF